MKNKSLIFSVIIEIFILIALLMLNARFYSNRDPNIVTKGHVEESSIELLAKVWEDRLEIDFPVYVIIEGSQENMRKWYNKKDDIVMGDSIIVTDSNEVEFGIVRLHDVTEETLVHELIHISNQALTEDEVVSLTEVKLRTKYK